MSGTIAHARAEQLRCAALYPDPGAWLGCHDWFAEEILMEQEKQKNAAQVATVSPPKPYYEHAGITIYHGDCREILPSLPKVDLVLTDPPYGEKTHNGARSANSLGESTIQFAPITDSELLRIAERLVEHSERWVLMTCAWQHAARLDETGALVRLGVWVKPNGAPQFTGDRPGVGWEAVAILHKPGKKQWNGGGHHAVWTVPVEHGEHPTTKPLALFQKWARDFSDPGNLILDPFMGSGTTLVAAKNLGRRAIGIEIEEKYCEIAAKRLAQEVLW